MINTRIICENAVEEKDILYFINYYNSCLYSYDKKTKKTKRLACFFTKIKTKKRLYESIIKVNEKIIIAPSFGELKIIIFNLTNSEISYIDLSMFIENGMKYNQGFAFNKIINYEKYIYVIGQAFPGIVRINLEDNSTLILNSWNNDTANERKKWMFINGFEKDNIAYLPFVEFSGFIKLDLRTSETELIRFQSSITEYSGVVSGENNDLWFLGLKEPYLINVTLEGKLIQEYYLNNVPNVNVTSALFENPIRDKNGIYLFPLNVDNVFYFNINNKTCELCSEFSEIIRNEFNNYEYPRVLSFNTHPEYMYLIARNQKNWYQINLLSREFESFYVYEDEMINMKRWNYGIKENNNQNLFDLFSYINNKKVKNENQ